MATLNFSFTPAVGYTGKYIMVAYGTDLPDVPLGQTSQTGPFGSVVTGSITGVPTKTAYKVKIFTDTCLAPVGTLNLP